MKKYFQYECDAPFKRKAIKKRMKYTDAVIWRSAPEFKVSCKHFQKNEC